LEPRTQSLARVVAPDIKRKLGSMPKGLTGPDATGTADKHPCQVEVNVPIILIAAIAANGVIGYENHIPWHVATDLQRFRRLTLGKPILMGRRTYESIGRPLPGRISVVVSREPDFAQTADVRGAGDIATGLALAAAAAAELGASSIALIGGADLFAALIDRVARLHLTLVDLTPPGDRFFPPIDWSHWREMRRNAHAPGNGDEAAFTFVDFERDTVLSEHRVGATPPWKSVFSAYRPV
jgi:dihydrofolate reductase